MKRPTFKIYLNNYKRKVAKNGNVPFYIRVSFNRKKVEKACGFQLTKSQVELWDNLLENEKEQKDTFPEICQKINELNYEFNKYLKQSDFYDFIDLNTFLNKFFQKGKLTTELKFVEYLNEYYNNTILKDSTKKEGTKKNYRTVVGHLLKFIQFKKYDNLPLCKFQSSVAREFKNYLISIDLLNKFKPLSANSANGIIKKCRYIFKDALIDNKIPSNPFQDISIKTIGNNDTECISIEEVVQLNNIKNHSNEKLQIVSDIHLFRCLTGVSFCDLILLHYKDLNFDTQNNVSIKFKRQKSDIITWQYLTQPAIKLIEKYRNHPLITSDELFPKISNRVQNSYLKILGKELGLKFNLTTHSGRRTFRGLLSDAEIIDEAAYKSMMGHSYKGIDSVYNILNSKRLIKTQKSFDNFLTKYITNEHNITSG